LFDTDLQQRPALETLETEAPRAHAYGDWDRNGDGNPVDWVSSDRVSSARQDDGLGRNDRRDDDSAIIDVPEEPLLPPRQPPPSREPVRGQYEVPQEVPHEVPYVVSQEPPYMTPPPAPEPRFEPRHQPPPAAPPPPPEPQPQPQMQDWQPAPADGQWLPPETPGSHWVGVAPPSEPSGRGRSRHSGPDEAFQPIEAPPVEPAPSWAYGEASRRARARHSAEYRDYGVSNFAGVNEPPAAPPPPPPASAPAAAAPPQMAPPPAPEPAPRHRGSEPPEGYDPEDSPPSGGQSVADLLARLQIEPSGGGRRRRREG
jgi:hypothetical protein